jgi:Mrp family chromosome partitioning ATPase
MNADLVSRGFDGLASRVDATGFRSIGFTSALLGEGVSTIALGTALSLAEIHDGSVLLVDANWVQPSLTTDADLESAPGLADYLAGAAALATAVRDTARPRLSLLPVGDRALARPTLRGLASLLTRDAAAYRTVLVDLPPVLAGEQFVLPWAALLDQVLVVVREDATPLPVVRDALGRLGTTNEAQIVLNRTGSPVGRPALRPVRT